MTAPAGVAVRLRWATELEPADHAALAALLHAEHAAAWGPWDPPTG